MALEEEKINDLTIESEKNIGKKVEKYSGKPFKSHLWVNTIKGIDYMEVLSKGKKVKRVCYTFEEDDSKVCVERCKVIEE